MVSLNTETDRTLFFDLLPMDVGVISGFKAKLQLYTVPGQVFYNSTRKLVLKGVDGIVFVADSQAAMADANRESLENLRENLRELGMDLRDIPMVFQWNKRDLKQILSVPALERELNPQTLPSFQAIARSGEGVFETLRGISRLALAHIKRMYLAEAGPTPAAAEPAAESASGRPAWAPPAPAQPPAPSWSAPTPAPGWASPTPGRPLGQRDPGARSEAARREAFETATPTPPAPAGATTESLAEALSFLDLPSALDLFDQVASETALTPASEAESGVDGSLKVMPPLVVKRLSPPSGPGASPMAAAANGVPVPRLVLQPPVPPLPRLDPDADTRPGPGLRVALPPGIEGDLELQVVVRHRGEVVAQASALVPGTGIDGSGLAVEWKRV
jgi:signal recognition particle receptor subunit beta